MATFGRLRSLRHERPICRKFPGWTASGAVGLVLFLARLVPDLAIAQSDTGYARAGELLLAKPARQSCFSVGVGARQWREIRTIYLRVHLAAGGRIRPHTHPDERNSTVLKGVLYVGFGRIFDESKLVAIPTGQCASSRQCATRCYGQGGRRDLSGGRRRRHRNNVPQ